MVTMGPKPLPDKPTPEQIFAFILDDWFDVSNCTPALWADFQRLLGDHGWSFLKIEDEADRECRFNGDEADEVWMDRP